VLGGTDEAPEVDEEETRVLRETLRAERPEAFFDRGPGYPLLSGGRTSAEVDAL
jgi:N-methylhydantoinase B